MSNRRNFIKSMVGATAGVLASGNISYAMPFVQRKNDNPRIRFSVIGINHGHIYGQVDSVRKGEIGRAHV